MTRFLRRITALAAVAAIAFAQLAVSAYACPADQRVAHAIAAQEAAPAHCDEPQNPNLCERHCDYGASSVGAQAAAADASHAAAPLWRVELVPVSASPSPRPDWRLARDPAPPPPILFGALRI